MRRSIGCWSCLLVGLVVLLAFVTQGHAAGLSRKQVRVAMVTYEYPQRVMGGLGFHAGYLVPALGRAGHQVRVLTPKGIGGGTAAPSGRRGVHLHHLSSQQMPEFAADHHPDRVAAFQELTRKELRFIFEKHGGVDVIHAQDTHGADQCIEAGKKYGAPVVVTYHALEAHKHLFSGDKTLTKDAQKRTERERRVGTGADAIIAVSEQFKSQVLEEHGFAQDKVHVVYNGVDYERFDHKLVSEQDIETWRNGLVEPGKPMIVYYGRDAPQKGLESLVRSVAETKLADLGAHAFLFGTRESMFVSYLRTLVTDLKVADRVHFMPWVGPDAEKRLVMSGGDVYVVPSLWESFGMTVAEGMALKRSPTVVSDIPVFRELFGGADATTFFRTGDARDLAAKLAKVLTEPSGSTRNRVKRAFDHVNGRFDWNSAAEQTAAIYASVAAGTTGR